MLPYTQVDRIGDLLESGELKDIIGVPTSERTYEQAKGALLAATLSGKGACRWMLFWIAQKL